MPNKSTVHHVNDQMIDDENSGKIVPQFLNISIRINYDASASLRSKPCGGGT